MFRKSNVHRRLRRARTPLGVESLEPRLPLAQLITLASVTTDQGNMNGTPGFDDVRAETQVAIGLVQAEAVAETNIQTTYVSAAANSLANATARADTDWIVRGAAIGQTIDVVATLEVDADLMTNVTLPPGDSVSRISTTLRVDNNATPSIDSRVELSSGTWTLGTGWSQRGNVATFFRTATFSLLVGDVFTISTEINGFARGDSAIADARSDGGLSLSLATVQPGLVVVPYEPTRDTDGDGVADEIEDRGPNQGDGDRDGSLDKFQATVASVADAQGNYVTLRLEDPTTNGPPSPTARFDYVSASSKQHPQPSTTSAPLDVAIAGAFGSAVQLRIISPFGTNPIDDYFHYGPTPTLPTNWFSFPYDGNVGARILNNNDVVVVLKDDVVPGDSGQPRGFGGDGRIEFSSALSFALTGNEDTDGDGIPDSIENGADNNGDGNLDGIADRDQSHVASFASDNDVYVTLDLKSNGVIGSYFKHVGPVSVPHPIRLLDSTSFYSDIHVPAPFSTSQIAVDVFLSSSAPTDDLLYRHFGPEASDPYSHWFDFPIQGRVGAERVGNKLSLLLVDDALGDLSSLAETLSFGGVLGRSGGGTDLLIATSFLDGNRNGFQDANELPLSDVGIYVDSNANGIQDPNELAAGTGAGGNASLLPLGPTSHLVKAVDRPGYEQTVPAFFFGSHVAAEFTSSAWSSFTGDFNQDGHTDAVVIDDAHRVLLNRGDGYFVETDRMSYNSERLAIADFNADGLDDIAIPFRSAQRSVSFHVGKGNGQFEFDDEIVAVSALDEIFFIEAADVTGNAIPDLVFADKAGNVEILKSNGQQFPLSERHTTGRRARALDVFDFDGDTDLDIAISHWSEATTLLRNDGFGRFTLTTIPIAGQLEVGNFNSVGIESDGYVDLVVSNATGLTLLYGDASGTFSLDRSRLTRVPGGLGQLQTVDIDLDGHDDLVAVRYAQQQLVPFVQRETIRDQQLTTTFELGAAVDVGQGPIDIDLIARPGQASFDILMTSHGEGQLELLQANPQQYQRFRGAEDQASQPLVEFGFYNAEQGAISGRVWSDVNGNGIRDPSEPFHADTIVYIDRNADQNWTASDLWVQTDPTGAYEFPALPPGQYDLRVVVPSASELSFPSAERLIEIQTGQQARNIDFGIAPPAVLAGTLFYDADQNGSQTTGEQPLEGWSVFLDDNRNGRWDANEPRDRTDVDGRYTFSVPSGDYAVTLELPRGWEASTETAAVTLVQSEQRTDVDFALQGSLRFFGNVWRDDDADGTLGVSERRTGQAIVYWDRNRNRRMDVGEVRTNTTNDGRYELNVPPGEHQLRVDVPALIQQRPVFTHTHPVSGVHELTATVDGIAGPYGFGWRLDRDSRGRVWVDTDLDGVFDPGEIAYAGASVYVDANANGQQDVGESTTTTDQDGRYVFAGDVGGNIRLADSLLWRQTSPLRSSDRLVTSSHAQPIAQYGNHTVMVDDTTIRLFDQTTLTTLTQAEATLLDRIRKHGSLFVDLNSDGQRDVLVAGMNDTSVSLQLFTAGPGGSFTTHDANLYEVAQPAYYTRPCLGTRPLEVALHPLETNDQPDQFTLYVARTCSGSSVQRIAVDLTFDGEEFHLLQTRDYSIEPIGDTVYDERIRLVENPQPLAAPDVVRIKSYDTGNGIISTADVETYDGRPLFTTEFSGEQIEMWIVDFDDDGDLDMLHRVRRTFDTNSPWLTYVVERLPAGFRSHVFDGRFEPLGDINDDGMADLFETSSGNILLQTNEPNGSRRMASRFFAAYQTDVQTSPLIGKPLKIGDFNNDGQIDLYDSGDFFFGPFFEPRRAHGRGNITVTRLADGDLDGVPATLEANGPNRGDGNNDGQPDAEQRNVATFPNAVDGSYITLESPAGTNIEQVSRRRDISNGDEPAGVEFPFGFVSFVVTGLAPGEHIAVRLISHATETPQQFYKYGPTPANPNDHFYLFDAGPQNDCATDPLCVGARISGNVVTLYLTDGAAGDADLTPNGRIVDPGGIAIASRVPGDSNGDGVFNSSDLVQVFMRGHYEDDRVGNSSFADGDWNGDGEFNSSDLVFVFRAGSFVAAARARELESVTWVDLFAF